MIGLTKIVTGMCAAVVAAAVALIGCAAAQHPKTLPNATCGRVITHMLTSDTQLLSQSPGALSCFDAAVRSCRAASIGVTEMGVDSGAQYVFAVEAGTPPCQVTEFSQYYAVSNGGHESPVTSTGCSKLAFASGGVTFSCAGNAYLIPATVSSGV